MLGDYLLGPLRRYLTSALGRSLAKYISNINVETLGVGGDIILRDLELRLDVLQESLNIPLAFEFSRGFIKELRIQIFWTQLFSRPIHVKVSTIEIILTARSELEFMRLQLEFQRKKKDHANAASDDGSNIWQTSSSVLKGNDDDMDQQPSPSMPSANEQDRSILDEENEFENESDQGWFRNAVRRILANVTIEVNDLVLKYEHANVVLATSFGSLQVYSADPENSWKASFQEPKGPCRSIHKAFDVKDLTINLESLSGESDLFRSPHLLPQSARRGNIRRRTSSAFSFASSDSGQSRLGDSRHSRGRRYSTEMPVLRRAAFAVRAQLSVDPTASLETAETTAPTQASATAGFRTGIDSKEDPYKDSPCLLPALCAKDLSLWRASSTHHERSTKLKWMVVAIVDIFVKKLDFSVSEEQFVMLGNLMVLPDAVEDEEEAAEEVHETESPHDAAEGEEEEDVSRMTTGGTSVAVVKQKNSGWGQWAWSVVVGDDMDTVESEFISEAKASAKASEKARRDAARLARETKRFLSVAAFRIDQIIVNFLEHKFDVVGALSPRNPRPESVIHEVPVANIGMVKLDEEIENDPPSAMSRRKSKLVSLFKMKIQGLTVEMRKVDDGSGRHPEVGFAELYLDVDATSTHRFCEESKQFLNVLSWGEGAAESSDFSTMSLLDSMPHPWFCWSLFHRQNLKNSFETHMQRTCCLGSSVGRSCDRAIRARVFSKTGKLLKTSQSSRKTDPHLHDPAEVDISLGSLRCRLEPETMQGIYSFLGFVAADANDQPQLPELQEGAAGATLKELAAEYASMLRKDESERKISRPIDLLMSLSEIDVLMVSPESGDLDLHLNDLTFRFGSNLHRAPKLAQSSPQKESWSTFFPDGPGVAGIKHRSETLPKEVFDPSENASRCLRFSVEETSKAALFSVKSLGIAQGGVSICKVGNFIASAHTTKGITNELQIGEAMCSIESFNSSVDLVQVDAIVLTCCRFAMLNVESGFPPRRNFRNQRLTVQSSMLRAEAIVTFERENFFLNMELESCRVVLDQLDAFRTEEPVCVQGCFSGNMFQRLLAFRQNSPLSSGSKFGLSLSCGIVSVDMVPRIPNFMSEMRNRAAVLLSVKISHEGPSERETREEEVTAPPIQISDFEHIFLSVDLCGGAVALSSELSLRLPSFKLSIGQERNFRWTLNGLKIENIGRRRSVILSPCTAKGSIEIPVDPTSALWLKFSCDAIVFELNTASMLAIKRILGKNSSSKESTSRNKTSAALDPGMIAWPHMEFHFDLPSILLKGDIGALVPMDQPEHQNWGLRMPSVIQLRSEGTKLSMSIENNFTMRFSTRDVSALEYFGPSPHHSRAPHRQMNFTNLVESTNSSRRVLEFLTAQDLENLANSLNIAWNKNAASLLETLFWTRECPRLSVERQSRSPLLVSNAATKDVGLKPTLLSIVLRGTLDAGPSAVDFALLPIDLILRPAFIVALNLLQDHFAPSRTFSSKADRHEGEIEQRASAMNIMVGRVRIFLPCKGNLAQVRDAVSCSGLAFCMDGFKILSSVESAGWKMFVGPLCALSWKLLVRDLNIPSSSGAFEMFLANNGGSKTSLLLETRHVVADLSLSIAKGAKADFSFLCGAIHVEPNMSQVAQVMLLSDFWGFALNRFVVWYFYGFQRSPIQVARPILRGTARQDLMHAKSNQLRFLCTLKGVCPRVEISLCADRSVQPLLSFSVDEIKLEGGKLTVFKYEGKLGVFKAIERLRRERSETPDVSLHFGDNGDDVLEFVGGVFVQANAELVREVLNSLDELKVSFLTNSPDFLEGRLRGKGLQSRLLAEARDALAPFEEAEATARVVSKLKVLVPGAYVEFAALSEGSSPVFAVEAGQIFIQQLQRGFNGRNEIEGVVTGFKVSCSASRSRRGMMEVLAPCETHFELLNHGKLLQKQKLRLEFAETELSLSLMRFAAIEAVLEAFVPRRQVSKARRLIRENETLGEGVEACGGLENLRKVLQVHHGEHDLEPEPGQIILGTIGLGTFGVQREDESEFFERDVRKGSLCAPIDSVLQREWVCLRWTYFEPRKISSLDLLQKLTIPDKVCKAALPRDSVLNCHVECQVFRFDTSEETFSHVASFALPIEKLENEGAMSKVDEFAEAFTNLVDISMSYDTGTELSPSIWENQALQSTFPIFLESAIDPASTWMLRWRSTFDDETNVDNRITISTSIIRSLRVNTLVSVAFCFQTDFKTLLTSCRVRFCKDELNQDKELFTCKIGNGLIWQRLSGYQGARELVMNGDLDIFVENLGKLTLSRFARFANLRIIHKKRISSGCEELRVNCERSRFNVSSETLPAFHLGVLEFSKSMGRLDEAKQILSKAEEFHDGESQPLETQYVVVNETARKVWFGQYGTSEIILLEPGERKPYSWKVVKAYLEPLLKDKDLLRHKGESDVHSDWEAQAKFAKNFKPLLRFALGIENEPGTWSRPVNVDSLGVHLRPLVLDNVNKDEDSPLFGNEPSTRLWISTQKGENGLQTLIRLLPSHLVVNWTTSELSVIYGKHVLSVPPCAAEHVFQAAQGKAGAQDFYSSHEHISRASSIDAEFAVSTDHPLGFIEDIGLKQDLQGPGRLGLMCPDVSFLNAENMEVPELQIRIGKSDLISVMFDDQNLAPKLAKVDVASYVWVFVKPALIRSPSGDCQQSWITIEIWPTLYVQNCLPRPVKLENMEMKPSIENEKQTRHISGLAPSQIKDLVRDRNADVLELDVGSMCSVFFDPESSHLIRISNFAAIILNQSVFSNSMTLFGARLPGKQLASARSGDAADGVCFAAQTIKDFIPPILSLLHAISLCNKSTSTLWIRCVHLPRESLIECASGAEVQLPWTINSEGAALQISFKDDKTQEELWSEPIFLSHQDQYRIALPVHSSSLDNEMMGWVCQLQCDLSVTSGEKARVLIQNRVIVRNFSGVSLKIRLESPFGEHLVESYLKGGLDGRISLKSFFSNEGLRPRHCDGPSGQPGVLEEEQNISPASFSGWLMERSERQPSVNSVKGLFGLVGASSQAQNAQDEHFDARLLSTNFRLAAAGSSCWSDLVSVATLSEDFVPWKQTLLLKLGSSSRIEAIHVAVEEDDGVINVFIERETFPTCVVRNTLPRSILFGLANKASVMSSEQPFIRLRPGTSLNFAPSVLSSRTSCTPFEAMWNEHAAMEGTGSLEDNKLGHQIFESFLRRGLVPESVAPGKVSRFSKETARKWPPSEEELLNSFPYLAVAFPDDEDDDQDHLIVFTSPQDMAFFSQEIGFREAFVGGYSLKVNVSRTNAWSDICFCSEKPLETATSKKKIMDIALRIDSFHVSLFDTDHLEMIHAHADDLEFRNEILVDSMEKAAWLDEATRRKFSVRLSGAQVDSYIAESELPVILYFNQIALSGEDDLPERDLRARFAALKPLPPTQDAFMLAMEWHEAQRFGEVTYPLQFDRVKISTTRMAVGMEDLLAKRLAEILTPIAATVVAQQKLRKKGPQTREKQLRVPKDERVFIRKLEISEMELIATIRSSSSPMFVGIDRTYFRFSAVDLSDIFEARTQLRKELTAKYIADALLRSPALLGSLELLGNPVGFVRSIGAGVYDFFYLPLRAIRHGFGPGEVLRGVARGWTSLFLHLGEGALTSVSGFSGSIARNLDRLSFDPNYASHRDTLRRTRSSETAEWQFTIRESDDDDDNFLRDESDLVRQLHRHRFSTAVGIARGLAGLGQGVLGGATGIVTHPIEAATQDGWSLGIIRGIGRGLVGAVTKPIGGAADFIAQTSGGLMQDAGIGAAAGPQIMRNRMMLAVIPHHALRLNWKFLSGAERFVVQERVYFFTIHRLVQLVLTTVGIRAYEIERTSDTREILRLSWDDVRSLDSSFKVGTLLTVDVTTAMHEFHFASKNDRRTFVKTGITLLRRAQAIQTL